MGEIAVALCKQIVGNDLNAIRGVVEYPVDVHEVGGHPVAGLPETLHAPDAGAVSVRKFTDADGAITGSEWIYSDDAGELARLNSAERWDPQCEHVGAEGKPIDVGVRDERGARDAVRRSRPSLP